MRNPDKFQRNIANHYDRARSAELQANSQRALWEQSINQLNGVSHNGKRDIYDVYGYPQSLNSETGYNLMYRLSKRMGMANRLTWGMAKSCWRDGFGIYPDNDEKSEEIESDFITSLNKRGMNKMLERADILNRIGQFSVLFIGIPDGLESDQPVGKVSGDKLDQVYFKPFAYDGITISKFNKDTKSPRYGLPEMYQVQNVSNGDRAKDTVLTSLQVHWTRIIHLNEMGLVSDIEGSGYLEPIYNSLLDIQKATGGSAEAYFRNARRIISMEIAPEFASTLASNKEARDSFDDAAKAFTNEQQDVIRASGAKVNQLQSTHASPLDTVKSALWNVASYTAYPIRILTGEGAGQLAGSEDQLTYNGLVSDRQNTVCSGWVVDMLKIFEMSGMIKLPADYVIRFPLQAAVSETQEVENNNKRADTLNKTVDAVVRSGGSISYNDALKESGFSEISADKFQDLNEDE